MDTEQKAKAYDEALKVARYIHDVTPSSSIAIAVCEQIFPEFKKESEDEKIRREIMEYITLYKDSLDDDEYKSWIAWLEKQKLIQNINKEDEEVRQYIVRIMEQRDINVPMVQKALTWLEKQGEQKYTWSEEDEAYMCDVIAFLEEARDCRQNALDCINWLKSLKQKIGG